MSTWEEEDKGRDVGANWHSGRDTLTSSCLENVNQNDHEVATKRFILSTTQRVFDPITGYT